MAAPKMRRPYCSLASSRSLRWTEMNQIRDARSSDTSQKNALGREEHQTQAPELRIPQTRAKLLAWFARAPGHVFMGCLVTVT